MCHQKNSRLCVGPVQGASGPRGSGEWESFKGRLDATRTVEWPDGRSRLAHPTRPSPFGEAPSAGVDSPPRVGPRRGRVDRSPLPCAPPLPLRALPNAEQLKIPVALEIHEENALFLSRVGGNVLRTRVYGRSWPPHTVPQYTINTRYTVPARRGTPTAMISTVMCAIKLGGLTPPRRVTEGPDHGILAVSPGVACPRHRARTPP